MLAASAFFGRAVATASCRGAFFPRRPTVDIALKLSVRRRLAVASKTVPRCTMALTALPLREVGHVHPTGKDAPITLAVWLDFCCPYSVRTIFSMRAVRDRASPVSIEVLYPGREEWHICIIVCACAYT